MTLTPQTPSDKRLFRAHASAVCLCLATLSVTIQPLRNWLRFSNTSLETSDLWLIPAISLYLLFTRRKSIFVAAELRSALWALPIAMSGVVVAIGGTALYGSASLSTLGMLLALIGAFLACYGPHIAWRARFPLAFAIFAVPIPGPMLNSIVVWLQYGSAAVVNALFWFLSVDFVREGMRFDFPTFAIQIASECSGIRSSFALLLLTVLIAETTLKTHWRKLLLVSAVVPLVLIKNGIRIVTLTILAMKVNPSFLDGPLHHRGGFVFFGLTLAIEAVFCWYLVCSERHSDHQADVSKHATKEVVLSRE